MTEKQRSELQILELQQGKSHLIEANAGTGKTYAIANLFLRFILNGNNINSLLVVTFTNAARDELRNRLRRRLVQALELFRCSHVDEGEDEFFKSLLDLYPEGDARTEACLRIELALLSMNESAIHTIHGFCQQTLTEHAVSSNQQFDIEQVDDRQLKKESIRDWWRCRTYNLSVKEFQWYQSCVFSDVEKLETVISPLLAANAPELHIPDDININSVDEISEYSTQKFSEIIAQWKTHHDSIRSRLVDSQYSLARRKNDYKVDKGLKDFFNIMDGLKESQQANQAISIIDASEINFGPYSYESIIENLNKDGSASDFDLPFFRLIDELTRSLSTLKTVYRLAEIQRAGKEIHQQLSRLKQQRGLLSFDDMIEHLHLAICKADNSGPFAATLARQFPLIMVDEFQDTDPKQYEIFHHIHDAGTEHTLIMIGDPKQAIYSFRGGDIFTYMQAQNDADHVWTLSTNWRSTPAMIEAFNHVFAHNNAFTYEAIRYHDSRRPPADKCKARALSIGGEEQTAMVFEPIPEGDDGNLPTTKEAVHDLIHSATAKRIAGMLTDKTSKIGDRKLQPGDIAVLVREKTEATALQEHLLNYGIRSVTITDESVWNTDEAASLTQLIMAIATPGDRGAARQALGAPILGLSIEEIYAIQSNPIQWAHWVDQLYAIHDLWLKNGFMMAYQALLHSVCDIVNKLSGNQPGSHAAAWLSRSDNPERMLTNLTHLGELLQQASLKHPGMDGLLTWAQQRENQKDKNEEDKEEAQLRLESDENLVKMITLHTSKGLQFPVVFLPYLWHCKPRDNKQINNIAIQWHEPQDKGFRCYFTPDGSTRHPAFLQAEHERLAEDIRLAYVALTRAESHCHVYFGPTGNNASWKGHPGQTGLAWLLSRDNQTLDLDEARFIAAPETINFDRLKGCDHIQIIEPQQTPEMTASYASKNPSVTPLAASQFSREWYSNWQIASFSSMARNVHQATRAATGTVGESFALQYTAGAHVGNFLHALLEHIKPNQPLREQLNHLVKYHALRHGLDPEQDISGLESWLHDILHTPLNDSGLTLAGIRPERQLHELEFDFSTQRVEHKNLQTCLAQYAGTELPKLDFQAFEGMVNGIIDLVFEYDGRYYIADYKSNLLGRQLDDYNTDILQTEIHNRRYDLQYLLYTLALHRHLRQRLPGYNYEQHFGGAYYLFLRGMTPATGHSRGVFFDRPPLRLIETLDQEIFSIPEAPGACLP